MKSPLPRRALIFLLPIAALSQSGRSPAFEVASIKLNPSGAAAARAVLPTGGLIVENLPMRFLVNFAYHLQDGQLAGEPDWLDTVRYDVTAKAEGAPPPEQIRLMVQSMLAERLRLAVHREKREAQVYQLTLAKGGLKLTPTAAGSCQLVDRDHPPTPAPPHCGDVGLGPGALNAWGVPLASLAGSLSGILGRTVIDKTGATGNYNIILRFAMDQAISPRVAGPPGAADASAPPDPSAPNIFTALEEQLGLKVESAKGEVEMLVIDHVERPSEN